MVLLTQNSTPVIGQISWVLGKIMNGIFIVLDFIGIPNVGLSIILFTIVVYLLMLPLTIRQQKFSKLSAIMNPELDAIKKKYNGKTDNESNMAQSQEIQAVYSKYGVSASGSCIELIIQLPILFALYRVIESMPAYVTKIGNTFGVLADKIISTDMGNFLQNSGIESIETTISTYGRNLTDDNLRNGIIDVLNRLSTEDMAIISEHYGLADLTYEGSLILSNGSVRGLIDTFNNFLGINVGNSPWYIIRNAWAAGSYVLLISAVMIPVLAALTQWINTKLMPSTDSGSGNNNGSSMAQSMKMMNSVMPLMSAVFCLTLPSGMGIYWISGSVVRSIQQVIINRYMDRMDIDEVIAKNSGKSAKKQKKREDRQERLNEYANMNTRNIEKKPAQSMQSKAKVPMTEEEKEKAVQNSTNYYNQSTNAKPGSLMARAGMVQQYNEKNNFNPNAKNSNSYSTRSSITNAKTSVSENKNTAADTKAKGKNDSGKNNNNKNNNSKNNNSSKNTVKDNTEKKDAGQKNTEKKNTGKTTSKVKG